MNITPIWLKNACEEIDAGFFSGDTFESEEARKLIKEYIERWQRQINIWSE